MAQNTDDLFASLGGSLMKDLWADLQVGEDEDDGMGWSLEQLERELAHLEDTPLDEATTTMPAAPSSLQAPPRGLSAASLVVSHAQERGVNTAADATQAAPASVDDAWSQSLEKFTALSLEKDFLEADSARKQQPAAPSADLAFLADTAGAEDYDVEETTTLLGPPPGLPTGSTTQPPTTTTAPAKPPGMPSPPSRKAVITTREPSQQLPEPPSPADDRRRVPPTPQNSFAEPRPPPPTPQNSFADSPQPVPPTSQNSSNAVIATAPPLPKEVPPTPHNSMGSIPGAPVMTTPQQAAAMGMAPKMTPSQQQQQQPVTVMARPPAWQQMTAPQAPPPPRPSQPVFCQSHPAAPPIAATALESSLMKARDIAYVLHSMLRPIMAMGTSLSDYNVQLLARHQGQPPLRPMQKGSKKGDSQQQPNTASTPQQRTKEWMEKHSTLGHVARTDVTRPRALIATSSATALTDKDDEDSDSKQRASLWKARMCIDQAYQAYSKIVEIWKAAPPGTIPPEAQPHMRRLYKYLGIKRDEKGGSSEYVVDKDSLQLLLKLPKGRTLLSRILEQALLPPRAVQALLPVSLNVLLSSNAPLGGDVTDDRLFRAWRRVLTSLPNIAPQTMLDGIQAFLEYPKKALGTTSRMECVHALLHRGNVMAGQLPEFVPEWREREQAFLKVLETSV